jgi:hypothetical protein
MKLLRDTFCAVEGICLLGNELTKSQDITHGREQEGFLKR